jgi:hypothetical protein
MARFKMADAERHALAARLARDLRELAAACERAAGGDEDACRTLGEHADRYWFGLPSEGGDVALLIEKDEARESTPAYEPRGF